ncbi:hypothetical protein [Pseudoxanthomonas sp. 10H]|uniref:hypothetical protein n=1 Tax=Pseudoxanthomonas sp. 10H TaxID=3242729 RepID=UPI003555C7A5
MDNEQLVADWQSKIGELCTDMLGRQLTIEESKFIYGHGGFLALEAIHDHVQGLNGQPGALARYLTSGAGDASA